MQICEVFVAVRRRGCLSSLIKCLKHKAIVNTMNRRCCPQCLFLWITCYSVNNLMRAFILD